MGYSSWTPAFKQGIIDRMANGETARQISKDLNISRSNIQSLYDDFIANGCISQINPEVEVKPIYEYTDEYIRSIWNGFLKQNEAVTMKHAYFSPDHKYYVDTCAPKWAKDLVKERWLTHTSFELLDDTDKTAIGMVIKDIRNYGKKRNI